jgi:hypothetical protein
VNNNNKQKWEKERRRERGNLLRCGSSNIATTIATAALLPPWRSHRLKRKADNSGWIRLNLDNTTEHQCIKKKKQQPPVITGSASTAAPHYQ